MRRQLSLKSDTWPEGMCVYVADISVKVGAHYPGRPTYRKGTRHPRRKANDLCQKSSILLPMS